MGKNKNGRNFGPSGHARSMKKRSKIKKIKIPNNTKKVINPRPAGPLDFPPPAGGGAFERPPPPMISAPGRRTEKRKAGFESSRKII